MSSELMPTYYLGFMQNDVWFLVFSLTELYPS